MFGLVSGIFNGNSLSVTALGTFDYLKNFLVIFIYAAFFRDFNDFRKLYRPLLFIATFLGTVAFVQFFWAMGSVYVLGKDITDSSVYIFSNIDVQDVSTLNNIVWRYGIFRTQSLTYHAYILGLFNLLILTIYSYHEERIIPARFIVLITGVLASVSRMAYGGLLFIGLFELVRRGKRFALLLLFIIISVLLLTQSNIIHGFKVSGILDSYLPKSAEGIDPDNIRELTRFKAMEIWKDHPLWGVGPGMFGGTVAMRYHSYIHSEYNLHTLGHLESVGNIEQFWFQIMAETGVIGTVCFANFVLMLFIMLYKAKEQAVSGEAKNLFSALIVFVGCVIIYSIGSGINVAPVLFTYGAFVGIGLGALPSDGGQGVPSD